jgi:hypothetical protein
MTEAVPVSSVLGWQLDDAKQNVIVLFEGPFGRPFNDKPQGGFFLSYFFPEGGHLSFRMDLGMAQKLAETLAPLAPGGSPAPSPDTPRQ